VQPTLTAEEPAFEAVFQATVHRTPIEFDYSRSGQSDSTRRHVQPWGVVTAQGRWYVAGLDTDRGEPRMFRLSRITSDVVASGPAGSFSVPENTDLRGMSESLLPSRPDRTAVVLARVGAANGLRRRGTLVEAEVDGPDGTRAWDRLEIPYGGVSELVDELLGYADTVLAESPEDLRAAVRDRLVQVVAP
jgi:proteasome accessory factor B